jgi:trans-aconitate methyltransferase
MAGPAVEVDVDDRDDALSRHWDDRYRTTDDSQVSWFEPEPTTSLELSDAVAGANSPRRVIDIGAGASRLVDELLHRGDQVTVLDISQAALDQVRAREPGVETVRADIRTWRPERQWDLWHDRALLHFLTDADDRRRYVETLREAIEPGGAFVLGVFAADGPDHCSGLPVHRFTANELRDLVGDADVIDKRRTVHHTPGGADQSFQWIAGRLVAGR